MEKKYEIVSLGLNCMPRTVLTRGKVKPSKADGELSCPFDLVVHNFSRMVYYIEENFNGYFDDLYFQPKKKWFFDFRKKGIWKKTDGTSFFHDKDCKKDDLNKLTTRINNRINNFNNIIQSEKPILFVLNMLDKNNDINKLYDVLAKKREGKPFKIVIFDIFNYVSQNTNKDIYILKLPTPFDQYSKYWNRSKFVKSPLGMYFEKCLCSYVKDVLKEFDKL